MVKLLRGRGGQRGGWGAFCTPVRHVEYVPHGQAFTVPEFSAGDESACAQILGEPIKTDPH